MKTLTPEEQYAFRYGDMSMTWPQRAVLVGSSIAIVAFVGSVSTWLILDHPAWNWIALVLILVVPTCGPVLIGHLLHYWSIATAVRRHREGTEFTTWAGRREARWKSPHFSSLTGGMP